MPCILTAIGLALTAFSADNTVLAMVGLTMAAAGVSNAQAAFRTLPAAFLGGAAAEAGIALANSLGNIAGSASTYVVGWSTDLTHSTSASLYVFSGILVIGGVLVLAVAGRLVNR